MKNKSISKMKRRYSQLTAQQGRLGLVLPGTITKRIIVKEDPHARGKEKKYGPYYQWTRKIKGKTVTVNLTATQAKDFQRAINEHRKLVKITQEMRELSLMIIQAETTGVNKRNRS